MSLDIKPTIARGPRSCSIAGALRLLGDKWSLLVVRECTYGVHRFSEIQRNTGAPRDILAARLKRLEDVGVLRRERYSERPRRYEYRLTSSGEELFPVLLALREWGERRLQAGAEVGPPVWHVCGAELELEALCRGCKREIRVEDLRYA